MNLSDGEQLAKDHSQTFKIPSKEDRESLRPGDFAKLIFNDKERMWVRIKVRQDNGDYHGQLESEPVVLKIARGTPVDFSPKHVIAIHRNN